MTQFNQIPAHKNLDLARELIEHYVIHVISVESVNNDIYKLLDGGDEYELNLLPGNDQNAVRANLKMAVELASEPVPRITTGRDRFRRRNKAVHERFALSIFARTALALLATDDVEA